MAEKLNVSRKAGIPSAPNPAGSIDFVKTVAGDGALAYVTGTNGSPHPLFGANLKFLAGANLPANPQRETMYVSTSAKVIYFVDKDGNRCVFPMTEGSLLANVIYDEAEAPVATTSTTRQSMLQLSEIVDPGIYIIDFAYGWTNNSTTADIEIEFEVDGATVLQPHREEVQDAGGSSAWTGTDQTHVGFKRTIVDWTSGGAHTAEVFFRSTGGAEVSMFDVSIVGWNMTGLG